MRKPRITLQRLLTENEEIWVKNRTAEKTGRESGTVVLQVGEGSMIDAVYIPPGTDPICLTDQVTPKLLSNCLDLFKAVKSGALELLDPDDAEHYYLENKEREAIVQGKINRLLHDLPDQDAAPRKAIISTESDKLHPKLGNICLKAKHSAISERQALELVLEQAAVLTAADYNYLIANGVYAGLKQWARDQLSALVAKNNDPVERALAQ